MKPKRRDANGNARRKLRARLKAEQRGCWICRAFGRNDHIDYNLPPGHPLSFEVDELVPFSKGGSALDYRNVDSVHRACNEWRSNKSVEQVLAIANRHRGNTQPLPQPWEF